MNSLRNLSLSVLAVLLGGIALPVTASAETIAVIGTGNVGGALGPQFAQLGHTIVYGSREPQRADVQELVARTGAAASAAQPAEAVRDADIVLLALPWATVEEVVAGLGDLSDKIIIDPTNPMGPSDAGFMVHMRETSNAQIIQDLAPDAMVVKAFNTMSSGTMVDPSSAGGPVTVPLAGNDDEAKATVAALARGIGLEAIDLGPLEYAHTVEGMLVVWVSARRQGTPFEYHLRQ